MKQFLFLFFILLVSCSEHRSAGKGAASETTNGSIAGVLIDAKGNGVGSARVELRDPLTLDSSIIDVDSTDAQGKYLLEPEKSGRYLVVARTDKMGSSFWVSYAEADSTIETENSRVDSLGTITGKLTGNLNDLTQLRVFISGLGASGPVPEDSTFEISSVPQGKYLIRVKNQDSDSVIAEEVCASNMNCRITIALEKMVMVDNFEGIEGYSQLQTLLDGAWWGMWNDTGATVEDNQIWINTQGRSIDSAAYAGKSLHAELHVGPAFAERPDIKRSSGVLIKIGGLETLDSNSVYYPMRDMDSIVFFAKGSGTFTVGINARSGIIRNTFIDTLVLNPDWTRIAIASDQFEGKGGLVWAESEMRELVWKTSDTLSDLWLDEIQIIGINPSGLLRR